MFTYLGESSSEFSSLVEKTIENNEVQEFDIVNKNGSFKGFKVNSNGNEGYAYRFHQGDFYEFASEDECDVTPSEKVKIIQKNIMQFAKIEKAFLAQRNDETKEIDNHKLKIVTPNLLSKVVTGTKATVDNVKGFVYKEKSLGAFSSSQDITLNIFVDANQVTDLGKVSSSLLVTQKEQAAIIKEKKKVRYEERLETLNKLDVVVSDPKMGDFKFDNIVATLEKLELQKEEISGKYSTDELSKKVREIKLIKDEEKLDAELMSYGISVKVKDELKDDKLEISITNKQGKEISKLSLDSVLYKSEDVTITTYDGKYTDQEKTNFEMVILDLDNEGEIEDRSFEIRENGKTISLEKSKFESIYRLFDDETFVIDLHSSLSEREYLETEDGVAMPISALDITDSSDVKNYVLKGIKNDDEVKTSLKSAFESKGNRLRR